MTHPDCDAFQQAVFEAGDAATLLERRPDLAVHHDVCAGCRTWLEAFMTGVESAAAVPGLAAGVLARTADGACARARAQSAAALDDPLPAIEQALVDAHLDTCAECRAVVAEMAAVTALLPALAAVEPGPAFTARVMAATSGRPGRFRALDRWRRQWEALVGRPRFAIEAAYALTVCLVLATANPLAAVEWTAARVEPLVQRVGTPAAALDALDARVQALRKRVAGGRADPASGDLASRWTAWASRTWTALVRSLSEGLTRILVALESVASWVSQWAHDLLVRVGPAPTEPGGDGVR